MASKQDVTKLLKSPKLTGREAARLMVQHFVDRDHRRGRLLTEPQIERLRRTVANRPAEEVDEYNALIETYRMAEYTLAEARVLSLEIRLDIEETKALLDNFALAWLLRAEQERRPAIVTAKQFEDLKARQRARKLQELHCLNEVILQRAAENTKPGHWRAYEDLSDADFDQAFDRAKREIEGLLAEGKLQPVELDFRADDDRLRYPDLEPPPGCENVYLWPQGEHGWSSDTPEEERERQLRTYVSGEQLYQAGLPEWAREVDTYQHWREFHHLPPEERGEAVAVLQEPTGGLVELDERGYYKARDLVEISGVPYLEKRAAKDGLDPKQFLRSRHRTIRKKVRVFLAYQPIMEILSDLISVKLHEDLETWQAQIEVYAESYAAKVSLPFLKPVEGDLRRWQEPEWLARKPELPAFTIEDLKPDPKRVEHLRQRMGLYLGEEWYSYCSEWLSEECELIDQDEDRAVDEEDGMAEEVVADGPDT